MNIRITQQDGEVMKNASTFLIICFLSAAFVLIGTGCKDPTPPNQATSKREPQTNPTPNDLHDEYIKKSRYLTAEQSEQWLRNNYFQVSREGNQYTIICNHVIPGPRPGVGGKRWNTTAHLSGRQMRTISGPINALATIDSQGRLRVKPQ